MTSLNLARKASMSLRGVPLRSVTSFVPFQIGLRTWLLTAGLLELMRIARPVDVLNAVSVPGIWPLSSVLRPSIVVVPVASFDFLQMVLSVAGADVADFEHFLNFL